MNRILTAASAICVFSFATLSGWSAKAQTINISTSNIALRSGETMEFGNFYWVNSVCKSVLKGSTKVEIMDGPPGVEVAIKDAMVVPRWFNCGKPVTGSKLYISAKDVDDQSNTPMTLRFTFKTADGERQRSHVINVALFPKEHN